MSANSINRAMQYFSSLPPFTGGFVTKYGGVCRVRTYRGPKDRPGYSREHRHRCVHSKLGGHRETRTLTVLLPLGFEPSTSANSAMRPKNKKAARGLSPRLLESQSCWCFTSCHRRPPPESN